MNKYKIAIECKNRKQIENLFRYRDSIGGHFQGGASLLTNGFNYDRPFYTFDINKKLEVHCDDPSTYTNICGYTVIKYEDAISFNLIQEIGNETTQR